MSSRDENLQELSRSLIVKNGRRETFTCREDVILENTGLGRLHIYVETECKPEFFQLFVFVFLRAATKNSLSL